MNSLFSFVFKNVVSKKCLNTAENSSNVLTSGVVKTRVSTSQVLNAELGDEIASLCV